MSTRLPDTRALNMGEVATRLHTHRGLGENSGVAFAAKYKRDRLSQSRSTCHLCGAAIRFDGIVWLDIDQRDPAKAYRCQTMRGSDGKIRRPHEPLELHDKYLARARILEMVAETFEGRMLRVMTMPGVNWHFEHELLHRRLHGKTKAEKMANRFELHAFELVDAVYRAAISAMPSRRSGVVAHSSPEWASFKLSTDSVQGFYRGDIFNGIPHLTVDAAWIDLAGPLTPAMINTLHRAWTDYRIREILCITSLKARWVGQLSEAITQEGGLTRLLDRVFGREHEDLLEYTDAVTMHQITYRRPLIWLPGDRP